VRLPYDFMASVVYGYQQGPRVDVFTGDYPLNAVAPRITLSNGRQVADPFFNISYPRAGSRNIDMLRSDDSHIVNLRIEKTLQLSKDAKVQLSADMFNAFNNAASRSFTGVSSWSIDARRSDFGTKTSYVPARVAQLGIRVVF